MFIVTIVEMVMDVHSDYCTDGMNVHSDYCRDGHVCS